MKLRVKDLENTCRWWQLRTMHKCDLSSSAKYMTRICYIDKGSVVHATMVNYDNYVKIGFEI